MCQTTCTNTLEEIFRKRLEQNAKIFTEDESKIIKYNFKLMKKIYCLGVLDGYN